MPVRVLGPPLLAVAVSAGLGGCGATPVDHHQIEQQLIAGVKGQKPDVAVSARCPSGITAKTGASFKCELLLDGNPVTYTVTISAVNGAHYEANTAPTQPVIDTAVVIGSVKQQLGAAADGATIACGTKRFVQLAVHSTFSCTVMKDGQTASLTATVSDDQGNVSFGGSGSSSAPPSGAVTTTAPPALPGD